MSEKLNDSIKEKLTGKETKPKVDYFSTGCTLVDLVVGGGEGMGFPAGKIVNFIGDKSAGKTFLAMETLAANYYKYGKNYKWNYDDGESGNSFDTGKLYGIDLTPEDKGYRSRYIEEFDANVGLFLKKELRLPSSLGIYCIDSLDGLSDNDKKERAEKRMKQADQGKEIKDDGTYGTATPKFLSQEFFREKTGQFADKSGLLIIVSQVRENMNAGLFGKKLKRANGKALDFYAHTCLWLATWIKIKKKDINGEMKTVGVIVEAYTDKSKTPRPYRKCRYIVFFDYGIDDIGTNINYLYDCWSEEGKLKKSAESIPWGGKKELNLTSLKEFLQKHEAYDRARDEKKEETGRKNLSIDWVVEWLQDQEELLPEYKKEFGEPIHYNDLIEKISNDPKLEKQLKQMVIDKWEAGEASIATKNRPRKYS
jgi:RecA/RadA recombinase